MRENDGSVPHVVLYKDGFGRSILGSVAGVTTKYGLYGGSYLNKEVGGVF
jgi:hypothetical protein